MSTWLKQQAVNTFLRFLRHEEVVRETDRNLSERAMPPVALTNLQPSYADLMKEQAQPAKGRALFITARFRSGSTLLWNLFRTMNGCTAYYAPFNERRWFDPEQRGDRVDASHRGVNDYWKEYEHLVGLDSLYSESWTKKNLYMGAHAYDHAMREFITSLIDQAKGTAVLQFNRVDFRLAWLKAQFPEIPILHLYRHPRDQWLSFLSDKEEMRAERVHETYLDGFYLDTWCKDLARYYPFLDSEITQHPYRRFYYLWKLSWLHGKRYADASLAYEDLVARPAEELSRVLEAVDWTTTPNLDLLARKIEAASPGGWKSYASDDWFSTHEMACERELSTFLDVAYADFSAIQ